MNNNLLEFEYNGSIVPFALTGNDVMINATEMVKLFPKKRINDFLSNQQTKELINVVESETGILASQLVVVKGSYSTGIKQGTWFHRKIAIAFAMWLNPSFYSWCLGKLDEIINNGFALRDAEIGRLNSIISMNQPKVDMHDLVLNNSEMTYSMIDIVKGCNFKVFHKAVYKSLEDNGFIMRQGKRWYLKSPWRLY